MSDLSKTFPFQDAVVATGSAWRWGVPLSAILALLLLLLTGGNVPVFYWMNRILAHAGDGLWIHLSLLADGLLVVLFVLPFLGRRADVVWQFVLAFVFGGIFVHGLKEAFSVLRPPATLSLDSFHLIGPALQNNAFPSGHTATIFILVGLLCVHKIDVRIKFGALLLAVLVACSRIASGVHWPLDVLAAAGGGWLVALAVVWIGQRWPIGLNVWSQRIFATIFTPLSIWAVWSLWHDLDDVYPGTGLMKLLLLFVCLALSIPGQIRLFGLKR